MPDLFPFDMELERPSDPAYPEFIIQKPDLYHKGDFSKLVDWLKEHEAPGDPKRMIFLHKSRGLSVAPPSKRAFGTSLFCCLEA